MNTPTDRSNSSDRFKAKNLCDYIDHTELRPAASETDIIQACQLAVQHRFKSVCLEAKWLPLAVAQLKSSPVLPITVISFPLGNDSTSKKVQDTQSAIAAGACEIGMVLNRHLLHEKDYRALYEDIHQVVLAAKAAPVKVILEVSELTENEKRIACAIAKAAGAQYVKTSTGFAKSGATVDDIRLMRETVGDAFGVKASGGIRSFQDAIKMIEAGATRLGTSASVSIIQGADAHPGAY